MVTDEQIKQFKKELSDYGFVLCDFVVNEHFKLCEHGTDIVLESGDNGWEVADHGVYRREDMEQIFFGTIEHLIKQWEEYKRKEQHDI